MAKSNKSAKSYGSTRHNYAPPKPFGPAPDLASNVLALELAHMLMTCRPHNGTAVESFCARYIDSLPGVTKDSIGNRIVRIGTAPVLWSSHTDTVHKADGKQKVAYGGGFLVLSDSETANCLGADCTTGVWLMRNMILRNVPGLYIFHHGEEVGGLGSEYIARQTPDLLDGIDYAIAFDRKGTNSVISHQWGRCASDTFVTSLCAALGPNYVPDDGGTFTDTANYVDLIPECTNISVGYYNQHTAYESQDVAFALHLLDVLCNLDVSSLPISRKPGDIGGGKYGNMSQYYGAYYGSGLDDGHSAHTGEPKIIRDADGNPYQPSMYDLVFENPEVATKILEELGISTDDFMYYVWSQDNQRH